METQANSINCHACGHRFTTEVGVPALPAAQAQGWRHQEATGRNFCRSCLMPKHPINTPYVCNDDRVPIESRGMFVDTVNIDGSISIWRLRFNPQPVIEFVRCDLVI